jgi:hypothetical protein
MAREDIDVSREMQRILSDEGIKVLVEAELSMSVETGPQFFIQKGPPCARPGEAGRYLGGASRERARPHSAVAGERLAGGLHRFLASLR